MYKNIKGFSAVELLLIIVILGMIGGTGWYVLSQRNKAELQISSQTEDDKSQSDQNQEVPTAFDPKGEIVKSDDVEKVQKLTYSMPAGWQRQTESENEWVTYLSPDFKGAQLANGSAVYAGGEMSVSAYKQDEPMSIKQMHEGEDLGGAYFKFEKYTKIGEVDAVQGTCGHFGRAVCLAAVYDGFYYQIGYRQVDESHKNKETPENKYQNEFDSVVKSLKFN